MMMMIYGFMYKIKNLIMGLLDKKKKKQEEHQKTVNKKQEQIEKQRQNELDKLRTQLSPNEIQYLINLIGRSDFKGTDLQTVFSITAKLQNQLNS